MFSFVPTVNREIFAPLKVCEFAFLAQLSGVRPAVRRSGRPSIHLSTRCACFVTIRPSPYPMGSWWCPVWTLITNPKLAPFDLLSVCQGVSKNCIKSPPYLPYIYLIVIKLLFPLVSHFPRQWGKVQKNRKPSRFWDACTALFYQTL
jgi:hypothetical protein